ncbi:hypothetical protein MKZ38_001942 [Zalerion maritima]|uniref:Peroxisomal membrane protein PEX14 n=1 Tax=Zalerion maritima TaxID=339359 RepID=A0AAD5WRK5_9PEZI|nr:hypothetical protein MKZ38_001942 [Zalerion maritima]
MSNPESKADDSQPAQSEPETPPLADEQQTQTPAAEQQPAEDENILDQARKFLEADEVKNASREKKASFLRSKGLEDVDVETLLDGQETAMSQRTDAEQQTNPPPSPRSATTDPTSNYPSYPSAPPSLPQNPPPSAAASMPPIITYPEFLTKPVHPTPLITVSRLLSILYASAGAGAALYGTSKFIINPMLETQTSARESLAETADGKLTSLVSKLEGIVSVVPPSPKPGRNSGTSGARSRRQRRKKGGEQDDDSEAESDEGGWDVRSTASSTASDPTEMFHRDIGTQTTSSLPNTPISSSSSTPNPKNIPRTPSEAQHTRLSKLNSSLRDLCTGLSSQTEDTQIIGTVVDLLREDLDKMTYPAPETGFGSGGGSSYSIYGYGGSGSREPNDEIKKSREEIRSLKGVLLSARTFPR